MKNLVLAFALFTFVSAPAHAEARRFRVVQGTPSGLGLAWGLADQDVDFEAVEQNGTGQEVFSRHYDDLRNYLVDLHTNRILATITDPSAGDVVEFDIHPEENYYDHVSLAELPLNGDELGAQGVNSLVLKLESDVNYHHPKDDAPAGAYLVNGSGIGDPQRDRAVLATATDLYQQLNSQIMAGLPANLRRLAEGKYPYQSFRFEAKQVRQLGFQHVLAFHLFQGGAWNDESGKQIAIAGSFRIERRGSRLLFKLYSLSARLVKADVQQ